MLTRKIENNTVISMLLTTGQEIVGKFVEMNGTEMALKNVVALTIVPSNKGPGSLGVSMMPFMLGVTPTATLYFDKHAYVTWAEAEGTLKSEYTRQTSSLVTGDMAQAMASNLPPMDELKKKFKID